MEHYDYKYVQVQVKYEDSYMIHVFNDFHQAN